ncbi:hypothetical protein EDB85DRAFT_2202558 [Lactarius pseudohatsudake]|nr:hypothetical protein EDB85DRAFT_2202558 [Lactarius pseudohatsudake]
MLIVDEVDKAPEHVVAIFRSLAGQGELTLTGGASSWLLFWGTISAATTRKAKKPLDMQFDPQKTDLDKLKHGQEDPSSEAHMGGNTFAGSTGGRDTAGLGGRGGFKHLHKRDHNINQAGCAPRVEDIPESMWEHACLMARKELEVHLAELNMTSAGADSYRALLTAVQAHIAQLHNLLERDNDNRCDCNEVTTRTLMATRQPQQQDHNDQGNGDEAIMIHDDLGNGDKASTAMR